MTEAEKLNLKIKNIIFYIKHLKKSKDELCKNCGKPKMLHFYRNLKINKYYLYRRPLYTIPQENTYCFPYGLDKSEFRK